jgi:hypothetical protein
MMTTQTSALTQSICTECGASLEREAREAYGDLYGPARWQPADLAVALERQLTEHPAADDAHALGMALACWLSYPPEALVAAVRHRLAEEGGTAG